MKQETEEAEKQKEQEALIEKHRQEAEIQVMGNAFVVAMFCRPPAA